MADEKKAFEVEIITPERIFYTGEATMIEFNTTEGEIGVFLLRLNLYSFINTHASHL